MFNTNISVFETFDAEPVGISLSRWIRSCMNSNSRYAEQVKKYRKTGNQDLKKGLPLATVGAICEGGRKLEDVKQRTGWIALDIDGKDNPHLDNAAEVRDTIANICYVAFAGLSVSGQGVWALVKIENSAKQEQYFEQLKKDFLSRGIVLDSTKGKNPNDARFYSFDPDSYLADEFEIYDRLPQEKPKQTRQPSKQFNTDYSLNDTRDKVETLISKIQDQRLDITGDYHSWRDLGFAFEDEFGEQGRDYFHAISEFYPDYSKRETDRQYTHCLRHSGSGISVGTFFHRCREYGITLHHEGGKDSGSTAKFKGGQAGDPAPNGHNPYTGEVFDERGYPSDWDDIELDNKGDQSKELYSTAI